MPSLKDVARLAGVSTSTVSRAINGTIPVSEETRLRVEKAVRDMGYKPNLVAQSLRIKSTRLLGLVVPEMQHETFISFIRFTEEAAEAKGYNLIIGSTNSDPDREERFIENLIRRNIDGIIFSRVSDKSHVLKILDRTKIPVVIIDRTLEREDIPSVVMDNYESGKLVAEHLLSLGHRAFACITGPLDIAINRDRLAGFRDTVLAGGGTLEDKCIYEGNFKFESGKKGIAYLLDTGARFTALWAQNDYMAVGVLNLLSERGIAVPGEISVAGLDNIQQSWMMRPSLTTVAQPFREMCTHAVDIIIDRAGREDDNREKIRVMLKPELIVRETTARPPEGSFAAERKEVERKQ
ncbi:MAG: LacI family DNA-binding transcriptional regulator [Rectinema subterraneum]|uniref:LacI family DNA-binding transcriptional regulator n=1 Tax=Rectinema subterraneum TaxID=2653714 RepID=UPI003C7DB940